MNKTLKRCLLVVFSFLCSVFFSCNNQAINKNNSDVAAKYASQTLRNAEESSESAESSESSQSTQTDASTGEDSASESNSKPYSEYGKMSFYPEENISDLYDAISYVVTLDEQNGHPLVIKDGENYYEVTGVGYSPSKFIYEGDSYTDRFYAQTTGGVYLIGVAIASNDDYLFHLCTKTPYGKEFMDVYNLYRY